MDIASPSNRLVMDKPPKDFSKYKFLGECGRDFRNLIYDIYSPYKISKYDTNNYRLLDQFLHNKSNLNFIGYITFNYDCYLEDALVSESRKFRYIDRNSYSETPEALLDREIPIVKLHGSLNWNEKLKGDFYKIDFHLPYSKKSQICPKYVDDYNWDQPAIILPTIFKQEINDDSRIEHNLTQTILQQWRTAISAGHHRRHYGAETGGGEDRVPGAPRRSYRSAEPHGIHGASRIDARPDGEEQGEFRRAQHRPRPFQGGQRRIRAFPWRCPIAGGLSSPADGRRGRLSRAARRR